MQNEYETLILNTLLDTYEKSAKSKGGESRRRVMIAKKKLSEIFSYNSLDDKRDANSALSHLAKEGVITFRYRRWEEENIVEEVVLNEENVEKAYALSSRRPLQGVLWELEELIRAFLSKTKEPEIKAFLEEELLKIEQKKTINRNFFKDDIEADRCLLMALTSLSASADEMTKRVFSVRVFHDSKKFETEVEAPLLKILRHIHKGEELKDDELLKLYSIVRYSEIIEFRGRLVFRFKDGGSLNCSDLKHGAYINSETIKDIAKIETTDDKVITIENKAVYEDYLKKHEITEGEIVIFHGGFYSPSKGLFLERIASLDLPWRHWSDIDLGGFRIFMRLKQNISPAATPYKMDEETLISNANKCKPLTEDYRKELGKLLDDSTCTVFYPVISLMLEKNIKLEQEALL